MNKLYVLVFAGLMFYACKPLELAENKDLKEAPLSFFADEDTTSLVTSQRQVFFTDEALNSLMDTALAQNLDIKKALQRVEMGSAGLRYAKGLSLPFVSGIGSGGMQRFGLYTMDGVGNFDTNFSPNVTPEQRMERDLPDLLLAFQASWEIDVWGKLKNRKKAALARYMSSIEAQKWLKTNIISDVAYLYYELLAINKELEILEATNLLQEQGLEIVRLQKEAGNVTELAVNQFEAQYLNFKALERQSRLEKIRLENELNFLLGRYPQSLSLESRILEEKPVIEVSLGTVPQLFARRPDVRQAEWELKASKGDVLAARAAMYPSFDMNGLFGFRSFNPSFFLVPESITYQLFGSLMAPLLNRSAYLADLQFAKAAQKEAFFQYQEVLIKAYTEVMYQSVAVDQLSEVVALKKEEVESLKSAVENANQLFMTGRANYLEVVIAQKNALQSQLELIQAQKLRYQAYVNLYRALGGE